MLRGVVTGNVWSTKRVEGMPNGALLEVSVDDSGQTLVAFDVLGSGVGERVLIATGSVAAAWFPGKPPPLDALIIGSIDEPMAKAPGAAAKTSAGGRTTKKTAATKTTAKQTATQKTATKKTATGRPKKA